MRLAKPRVLLPVFPGTNGEYETAEMFRQAGGVVRSLVFRDLTIAEIKSSLADLSKSILDSQILVLPGGFSAGDEPEGAGKFIELVFRHPQVAEALMEFLDEKRGLILGSGMDSRLWSGWIVALWEIRTMGRVPSFDRKPNWQASFSVCKDQNCFYPFTLVQQCTGGAGLWYPLPAGRDVL